MHFDEALQVMLRSLPLTAVFLAARRVAGLLFSIVLLGLFFILMALTLFLNLIDTPAGRLVRFW